MIRICFVCHGNICRSVSAQYILQNMVNKKNIADGFRIDSAATSTEEIGNTIYPPMKSELMARGVPIGSHRARRLVKEDYDKNDLIIGMDEENMHYMQIILGDDPLNKIHYLLEYTRHRDEIIDDPWFTRRFDICADQIEEGCRGLLEFIESGNLNENFRDK